MSGQLQALRTHLSVVKQSPADHIQEQFYHLMVRAKDKLGETSFHMAHFYYQYSNFILSRLEKNIDLFNADAVPSNIQNNQVDQFDDIAQDFQDSTPQNEQQQILQQNQQTPNQKQPNSPNSHHEGKIGNYSQHQSEQNAQKPINQILNNQENPNDEDIDDKELCSINLEFAITIYSNQLEKIYNKKSDINEDDALDGLRRCRTRLGDLMAIDENYQKAIQQYRKVIAQEQTRKGARYNRLISQLYFLVGNCLLYDNKPGCEQEAIISYIKSTQILISNLCIVEEYDISGIVLPTLQRVKVDRFPFLNKVADSENVKQIKDVVTCLLDKIQDTYDQIRVKNAYQAEKRKEEEEKKKLQFKPVSENIKVINLGFFGNRKRKPQHQNGNQNAKPNIGQQWQQKAQKNEAKQKVQQGSIGKENNSSQMNNDCS